MSARQGSEPTGWRARIWRQSFIMLGSVVVRAFTSGGSEGLADVVLGAPLRMRPAVFRVWDGSYLQRKALVASLDGPERIGRALLGYACVARCAGSGHATAHALAEAGYAFAESDGELARALAALSARAFEEHPRPGGDRDCPGSASALAWFLRHRETSHADVEERLDVEPENASALLNLSLLTGIPLDYWMWVSAAATVSGYPPTCAAPVDASARNVLTAGSHRKVVAAIVRKPEDSAEAQELISGFLRDAEASADAPAAYRESLDLVRSLMAFGRQNSAITVLENIARDAVDVGHLAEVTDIARRLTRVARGEQGKRRADALYAHILSLATHVDDLLRSVEVAVQHLDDDGHREPDHVDRWLMWSAYFSLHQLGFYEAALHWLQRIEPDEEMIGELPLNWAIADLRVHLGFGVDLESVERLRRDAVTRHDVAWIAELDYLAARVLMYENEPSAERALMLSVEGFRRAGARYNQARVLMGLGAYWYAEDRFEEALYAWETCLYLFDALGLTHMYRLVAFDIGRCMYLSGTWDHDHLESLMVAAMEHSDVLLFTTLVLQYAELAVERHPTQVYDKIDTALDFYARWRSAHTLTTWRAGLLLKETRLRRVAITACLASGADPAEAVALVVEGASQNPPKPPPLQGSDACALAAERMHTECGSPEADERIADVLGDASYFVQDPSVQAIPVTTPVRITIGSTRRERLFGYPGLRELDVREVAEQLGYPDWLWWSQWTDGATLHHGFVSSLGTCWYEGCDYAAAQETVDGYINAHPILGIDKRAPLTQRRQAIERRLTEAPEDEWNDATRLGQALIPRTLADHLRQRPGWHPTILMQPAAFAARIPPALLRIPGTDRRLLDTADFGYCPHPALFEPRPAKSRPGSGQALILDAAGERVCGTRPFDLPLGAGVDHFFTRPDLPSWAKRAIGAEPQAADPATITAALRAQPVRRLIYAGHVDEPELLSPGAGAFTLRGEKITAAQWLRDPQCFPAPEELVLIACSAAGSDTLEPLGLPTAALAAGTDRLIATLSPLLNSADMWSAASELLSLLDTMSFPAAVATMSRGRLDRWKTTADPSLHPMLWSPFIAVERNNAHGASPRQPRALP